MKRLAAMMHISASTMTALYACANYRLAVKPKEVGTSGDALVEEAKGLHRGFVEALNVGDAEGLPDRTRAILVRLRSRPTRWLLGSARRLPAALPLGTKNCRAQHRRFKKRTFEEWETAS